MKIFAKEELGRDGFVQAAAPFGTAAYLINGYTLHHGHLYLPVGTSTFWPLHCEMLKGMQDTFSNVDILFIDEKRMVGQKILTMVSERIQETLPTLRGQPIWKSLGCPLGGAQTAATSLRVSTIQGKCR